MEILFRKDWGKIEGLLFETLYFDLYNYLIGTYYYLHIQLLVDEARCLAIEIFFKLINIGVLYLHSIYVHMLRSFSRSLQLIN